MPETLENPVEQLIVECRLSERQGRRKVSDVHITSGEEPYLRIDGELGAHDYQKISDANVQEFIAKVGTAHVNEYQLNKCFTASYASQDAGLCRVHVQQMHSGTKLVIRLLHDEVPNFESLNLPEVIRSFADYSNGLVLVTGGTGSGKSTTLAALIDMINQKRNAAIYTVEDPIEYIHQSKRSDIAQMTVGSDTPAFHKAVESMLRMDPDVILVGEIRSPETALACLQGAETGHLVFASLHDNSAADTVTRLIGMFEANTQQQVRTSIASCLRAVVSQRLVPKIDKKGRVAVAEILIADTPFQAYVRDGKTHAIYAHIDQGRKDNMTTMEQSLANLVHEGVISEEAALDYANDKIKLTEKLRRRVA